MILGKCSVKRESTLVTLETANLQFFGLITVIEAAYFKGIHVVSINILSFNNINL